jgi:CubicO group peptidase (beta-lactamase class C family)
VKRISGRSLNVFCQERMFQPLGMKNTHFPKVCSVKLIGSW